MDKQALQAIAQAAAKNTQAEESQFGLSNHRERLPLFLGMELVVAGLKQIYQSITEEEALLALDQFGQPTN